jgi:formiminotetrahydrofolate cyclodeaminase
MSDEPQFLDVSVRDFLAATAAKQPTPGGGSVAAVVAGLATALGEMALNFTRGKAKYAQHAELHERLARRLEKTRGLCCDLLADDVAAYGMYARTASMPDGEEKRQAQELALAASVDVPRELAKLTLALLDDLKALAGACNPYLVSDLVAAAELASAAVGLCDFNVRINARQITDRAAAEDLLAGSAADRRRARELAEKIEQICREPLDGRQ